MKKRFRKRWIVAILSLTLIFGAGTYYLLDTYEATSVDHATTISVNYDDNKVLTLKSKDAGETQPAIIFYQGGKVDEKAYIELLAPLAEQGITVYIPSMPFELAVFDSNAAEKIMENYVHASWYIGGHSLGGSMASSYLSSHQDSFDGLFLLASYSTKNLKDFKGDVLSVYGDKDGVLNMKSYEKYTSNLPNQTIYQIIPGGNHAQFGSYGFQKGDGQATIDAKTQQENVRSLLRNMIQN